MAIHVALTHSTSYRYSRLVRLGPQTVRLRPAPHSRTPILSYSLKVVPKHHFLNWQQDPQSNYVARYVFPEPTQEFLLHVDLVAEMAAINPFDFFLEKDAETFPFAYEPALARELRPYLEKEAAGPVLQRFFAEVDRRRKPVIDFLVALNRLVQRRVWSRASRAATRPCSAAPGPAATAPGSWCSSCATSASPLVSSRVI